MTLRRLFLLVLAAAGLTATAVLLQSPAHAAPARPGLITLHQPGCQVIHARLFGDEWYNGHETKDGFTSLSGAQGRWEYAARTPNGELRPSGLVVGQDRPTMHRHLRDRADRLRGLRRRATAQADDVQLAPGVAGPQ